MDGLIIFIGTMCLFLIFLTGFSLAIGAGFLIVKPRLCKGGFMRRYFKYLNYVFIHKWHVMNECFRRGLFLRGVLHDVSKFRLSEFIPYARFFYEKNGDKKQIRDKTGYYKPHDTGDILFDMAWFLHQKRNDHHWQFWVLSVGPGESSRVLPMSKKAIQEMIADWVGAGKAQGVPYTGDRLDSVRRWFLANQSKMMLHPGTKESICAELNLKYCEVTGEAKEIQYFNSGRKVRTSVIGGKKYDKG